MKNILSFVLFFSFYCMLAQNDMKARIEYEEAEKAFSEQNYSLAYDKIKMVEQLLGKTNSKVLYLRIQIENQLLDSSFDIIKELRKNTAYFLDNYSEVEGIEDRYKEVYLNSKSLEKLPKTQPEFEKYQQQEISKKQAIKEEGNKVQLLAALKKYRSGFSGVNIGMKPAEIPSSVLNSFVNTYHLKAGVEFYGYTPKHDETLYGIKYKVGMPDEGISSIYVDVDSGKISQIFYSTRAGKRSSDAMIYQEFQQMVDTLKQTIGAQYVEEEISENEYVQTITIKTILDDTYSYKIFFQRMIKGGSYVQITERIQAE